MKYILRFVFFGRGNKKMIGLLSLLLLIQMPAAAQQNSQTAVLVFYTLESSQRGGPPSIYRDNQKVGEVSKVQLLRLVLLPGNYQFGLREDAPESERLSLSP